MLIWDAFASADHPIRITTLLRDAPLGAKASGVIMAGFGHDTGTSVAAGGVVSRDSLVGVLEIERVGREGTPGETRASHRRGSAAEVRGGDLPDVDLPEVWEEGRPRVEDLPLARAWLEEYDRHHKAEAHRSASQVGGWLSSTGVTDPNPEPHP